MGGQFLGVVWTARIAFSKRSWPYLLGIVIPWLLAQGQRSMTRLYSLSKFRRSLSGYYRFLSEWKFRGDVLSHCLFDLIRRVFSLKDLVLVADDTLVTKWGKQIFGVASYFDPVARPRPGFIWGHNWVVVAVVVRIGGCPVALPFWVRLYRPQSTLSKEEVLETKVAMVGKALEAVRSWAPKSSIDLAVDGAFNNSSLTEFTEALKISLVSRLRTNARLRADPPRGGPARRGRPSRYGPGLPKLSTLARRPEGWTLTRVTIYRTKVRLRVKVLDAWWPALGQKIRVVMAQNAKGKPRTTYFSCTDLSATPEQVIELYASRWSIEQLFSDVKTHLGFDSAEFRKQNSVTRHAALSFAFATWIHVWHHTRPSRSRWSRTPPPELVPVSFRQKLQELRAYTVNRMIFESKPRTPRSSRKSNALADLFATATTVS
jgi:hypothetical protein